MSGQALRVEEQIAPYLVAPQITDHLDNFASAPEGFKRLRELVLNLAVRGRLVPQNPSDEPASELLKKIAARREKLVKDGRIRKEKPLLPIAKKESPFALPKGWEWVRLLQLAPMSLVDGDWIESVDQDPQGGIRLIQLADIGVEEFKDRSKRFINEETFRRLKCSAIEAGDILIARLPSPIGRACIFPGLATKAITVVDVAILRPMGMLCSDYLVKAINSKSTYEQVEGFGKGATRFRISTGNLKELLIPAPPLAEQFRIVAKVEELMALIDRLEEEVSRGGTARGKLLDTLLAALADSPDAAATADAWAQLAPNFDLLLRTPADVDRLQQTLLTLAVKGRLVPQDPNDEPAAELLKRIRAEKERLVAEGKIKREKPLPAMDESLQQELPPTWQLVRINDLLPEFQNGVSSRGCPNGESVIVLRLADIDGNEISLANTRALVLESGVKEKYALVAGDVLIVRVNGSADIVGRFIPCRTSLPTAYCDHFIRMRVRQDWIAPDFLALVGKSRLVRDRISDLFITTAGQKTVNQGHIGSLLLPLPPLPEQSRIVSAVASLTDLCDRLRSRLAARCELSGKLATALTDSALQ